MERNKWKETGLAITAGTTGIWAPASLERSALLPVHAVGESILESDVRESAASVEKEHSHPGRSMGFAGDFPHFPARRGVRERSALSDIVVPMAGDVASRHD